MCERGLESMEDVGTWGGRIKILNLRLSGCLWMKACLSFEGYIESVKKAGLDGGMKRILQPEETVCWK